jgi:hypothetical protein
MRQVIKKSHKMQGDIIKKLRARGRGALNAEAMRVATLGRGADHLVLLGETLIGEYNHLTKRLTLYDELIEQEDNIATQK